MMIDTIRLGEPEVTTIYRWEIEDGPIVPNISGTSNMRVEVVKYENTGNGEYVDVSVQGRPVKKNGQRYENRPYFDIADSATHEAFASAIAFWKKNR